MRREFFPLLPRWKGMFRTGAARTQKPIALIRIFNYFSNIARNFV
jgi:hypothetical protein